jgi:CMP/dCMP kinase
MAQPNSSIIAIDGPAASGKGTLARNLAQKLNFAYMDTGALYRAVAFEILQHDLRSDKEEHLVQACQGLQKKLKVEGTASVLGNMTLRSDTIASLASVVASIPVVRAKLVDIQQNFAKYPSKASEGAILDGRDIGTVICPEAPLKLFVTAELEIRAQRRMKELHSKGISATYDAVLADMRARDARDSGRKAAPLRPAEDAVLIDSTHLSEGEMLELALTHAIKAFGGKTVSGA